MSYLPTLNNVRITVFLSYQPIVVAHICGISRINKKNLILSGFLQKTGIVSALQLSFYKLNKKAQKENFTPETSKCRNYRLNSPNRFYILSLAFYWYQLALLHRKYESLRLVVWQVHFVCGWISINKEKAFSINDSVQ